MRILNMLSKHKLKFSGILLLFLLTSVNAGDIKWFNIESQRKPDSFGVADTLKALSYNSDAVIDRVYVEESYTNVQLPAQNGPSQSSTLLNGTAITATASPTSPKLSIIHRQPLWYYNFPLCKPVHEPILVSSVCLCIRTVILLA